MHSQTNRQQTLDNAGGETLQLAVIIPTLNEYENIQELLRRLEECLANIAWEAMFVDDDSTDRTAELVREISRQNPRVRCIHRIGRRGLSSAVTEGMLATSAPYLAVLDADLQHDETLLPDMLSHLKSGDYDLVVGSRYMEGGGSGDWEKSRLAMSRLATRLSDLAIRTRLSDPMSGFFMITRLAFEHSVRRTSGIGFKILLDLIASSPAPLRIKELPYQFRNRYAGESKVDTLVAWEYLMMLADKLFGHVIPVRFLVFSLVGSFGVLVHLGSLAIAFKGLGFAFALAQFAATIIAMTNNFLINNWFTYRDKRLKGWGIVRGLFSFYIICSLGAVANVGLAQYIYEFPSTWWMAGMAGALVGAVWNYSASSLFTWSK